MRGREITRRLRLGCALAVLLGCFGMSATAGASPQWFFDGEALEGTETVTNGAPGSYFTIPGLTFGCRPLPLEATIKNLGGKGVADVINLPFGTCYTDSPQCTIESFEAAGLPWSSHLTTISTKNYLIMEGVKINIIFGGEECVLFETLVKITGTAGGIIDNENEEIIFSPTTFKATGTELKAFGSKIEWNAALKLMAIGPHSGEPLTVH